MTVRERLRRINNRTDSCLFFLQRQWVVEQVEYLSQYPDYYDLHINPANHLWKSLRGTKKGQVERETQSDRLVCHICLHSGYASSDNRAPL